MFHINAKYVDYDMIMGSFHDWGTKKECLTF
jgi:hypothetical protein